MPHRPEKKNRLTFDVNQSLKINPPNHNLNLGVKFIKRSSGKLLDLVTVTDKGISLQPRDKNIDYTQRDLAHSYKVNGVMYEKEVMVVELREDGKLELISGFGRYYVLQQLGVDTYFYDVVKFSTPRWKTVWKRRFNVSKDHTGQGTPQTEASYLNGLIELRDQSQLVHTGPNGDATILQELELMSKGQLSDKQKQKILEKFRQNNSRYASTIAMSKPDANAAAKKLGLPTSGIVKDVSSPAVGQVGFVCRNGGNLIKEVIGWAKLHHDYKVPVSIIAYVQHTDLNETEISKKRKAIIKTLKKIHEEYIEPICKEKFHNMVKFEGFLAQICGPDPKQDGRAKERGLVDVDGNIIYEMVDGEKVYPLSVAA